MGRFKPVQPGPFDRLKIGQYIRGFKISVNVSWDTVDNVIIPVNVSESFHWILVVFCISQRCLFVYDSLLGGVVHTKNVVDHVQSLPTMLPLFLVATDFFGKEMILTGSESSHTLISLFADPLGYVIVRNTPQQRADSIDCGLYTCALVEYVSHGVFDVSNINFYAINHRLRYAALLWDYARIKQNDCAISDSEATENVTSRFGGPNICKEAVSNV
ncbi:hypothetical protein P3S68_016885 [Capsicum galapagoense]